MTKERLLIAAAGKSLANDRRFYFAVALASPLVILVGLGRTYYVKFPFSTSPALSILVHLNSLAFSTWVVFLGPDRLIAASWTRLYCKIGIRGARLGSIMIVSG